MHYAYSVTVDIIIILAFTGYDSFCDTIFYDLLSLSLITQCVLIVQCTLFENVNKSNIILSC